MVLAELFATAVMTALFALLAMDTGPGRAVIYTIQRWRRLRRHRAVSRSGRHLLPSSSPDPSSRMGDPANDKAWVTKAAKPPTVLEPLTADRLGPTTLQLPSNTAACHSDLSVLNEDSREEGGRLHRRRHIPGTRVRQFAFDRHADNPYPPDNHVSNTVVCASTHDNPTMRGWYEDSLSAERAISHATCSGPTWTDPERYVRASHRARVTRSREDDLLERCCRARDGGDTTNLRERATVCRETTRNRLSSDSYIA
jgi:4-alpha-glucanotransferase